jgi:hypothetical protein
MNRGLPATLGLVLRIPQVTPTRLVLTGRGHGIDGLSEFGDAPWLLARQRLRLVRDVAFVCWGTGE